MIILPSATISKLDELLEFKNGKVVELTERGQYEVYGSNGIIGLTDRYNHENAIVIGRVGAHCGSVASSINPFWATDNTIVAYPKANRDEMKYYYYLLKNMNLNHYAGGSAQPLLIQSVLKELQVMLLSEREHRIAAAFTLSYYDDLIENNRRRIELLEEMARALYREWFVHFRFPGNEEVEMVDSELGVIPDGWTVSTLGKECKLIIGQSPKSQFYNEDGNGLPFHQGVKDFGSVIPNHRVYCAVDKRVAELGDILFSVRAPVGRINLADTKLIVGRGLHAIRHNYDKQAFLLYQLRNRFFKEDLIGSGTVFQAVTKSDMLGIELHIPPAHLVDEFELKVEPMVQLMVNLVKQNQILIQTRDLLLPHLVSGEIDVSEMDIAAPTSNAHTTSKYSD